jgi:hypothetical protein
MIHLDYARRKPVAPGGVHGRREQEKGGAVFTAPPRSERLAEA